MTHPYVSAAYAEALGHVGEPCSVPEWGSHVLRRAIPAGGGDAIGTYPLTALAQDADLPAGSARLRREGLVSVVLVPDPLTGPPREALALQLNRWRKTLVREFKALREPAMSDAEAETYAFQMKSFALGYIDAERMLGVGRARAREMAADAFVSLLDRACAK